MWIRTVVVLSHMAADTPGVVEVVLPGSIGGNTASTRSAIGGGRQVRVAAETFRTTQRGRRWWRRRSVAMVIRVDVHVFERRSDVGDGVRPGEAGTPGRRGVPARGAQGVRRRVRCRPVIRLHRTYPAQEIIVLQ